MSLEPLEIALKINGESYEIHHNDILVENTIGIYGEHEGIPIIGFRPTTNIEIGDILTNSMSQKFRVFKIFNEHWNGKIHQRIAYVNLL